MVAPHTGRHTHGGGGGLTPAARSPTAGVEHKPHCEEEAHIVLLEPAGTLNTEGATQQDTQAAHLTPTEGEWL